MRHHKANRKFGRTTDQRTALIRSLVRGLILEDKIETTLARAKEIRPVVEKLITRAKNPTLAARRQIMSALGTHDLTATKKLLETLGPKFQERVGGYTRITKLPVRASDAAPKAVIEFV
jgi:large subunit ribosomal protein L17